MGPLTLTLVFLHPLRPCSWIILMLVFRPRSHIELSRSRPSSVETSRLSTSSVRHQPSKLAASRLGGSCTSEAPKPTTKSPEPSFVAFGAHDITYRGQTWQILSLRTSDHGHRFLHSQFDQKSAELVDSISRVRADCIFFGRFALMPQF